MRLLDAIQEKTLEDGQEIVKNKIRKAIPDNQARIVALKAAKGLGITFAQTECEMVIKTCKWLLGVK